MSGGNNDCADWDIACRARKAAGQASNTVNREVSNAGNSINSALNQATGGASVEDVAMNYLTGGLIGYDGGIKPGIGTRAVTEGLGEVTGANALRAANNRASDLVEAQRREAELLRQQELERRRINEVQASRAAGRAQAGAFATDSSLGADASSAAAFNNLTKDFLGL